MRLLAAAMMLLISTALVLPGLTAQDKDDAKKADKKDAKADARKAKDEKKDAKDDKKDDGETTKKKATPKRTTTKKTVDPDEQKIVKNSHPRVRARIQSIDANSSGEFTVQLPFAYAPKQKAAWQWYQQQAQLNPYGAMQELRKRLSEANMVEVRTGPGMKVRTVFFPMEYDAKGFLKQPTAKQIAAMRGNTILPGFPAQFDALKPGQIVDLYIAKEPAAKKTPPDRNKKKKKVVDDDMDDVMAKPEVLMIVVVIEAPQRP